MKTILVIGACGVGKTWLMRELIKTLKLDTAAHFGMIGYRRNKKTLVLGVYDNSTFEGSDKLSMAVMRDVEEFLQHCKESKYKFIICEGDRFTNRNFIAAAKPYIIKIKGDGSVGRKKRGSSQSERHLKSIQTRVENLDELVDERVDSSLEGLRVICKLVA